MSANGVIIVDIKWRWCFNLLAVK